MKQKSTSKSARALVSLLACAAACSIVTGTLLAYFRTETPAIVSHPATAGLTFAQRVSYQRAIEDVYWRHRLWPKERPDHKPSLDEVMPRAQLEKKVADYLRNSQALEDYWQQPLTAEQLQAEMERMAQHTKQPEVLHELFEALGNDPYVIAECLARPLLSERLITNFYAHDQRLHGDLKRRAEADLQTHHSVEQMKQTSGTYSEIDLVRSGSEGIVGQASRLPEEQSAGGTPAVHSQDSTTSLKLNSRDWDENVQKLAAMFATANPSGGGLGPPENAKARPQLARRGGGAPTVQIKTRFLSSLQEDEGRYYATAVVKQTKERLKLATVEWRKEPLESWRARAERQMPKPMTAVTASYTLPTILAAANGCTDDTWATTATNVPTPRSSHTAVWTGSEMIVWGGIDNVVGYSNTGGRYDPAIDNWRGTSTTSAPDRRVAHTAVWTGSEMIIWGGVDGSNFLNTGGRYNPISDSWIATSTTNAPSARADHTAVWTDGEMIVWGGHVDSNVFNTGGRYNPGTDSWTSTNSTDAPTVRGRHTEVWSGSQMIVWGGANDSSLLDTGSRYCAGSPGPQGSLGNISTRSLVQTGEHVMIGGFIAEGTGPKQVIIRAIGPELTQYGIADALANPRLELHDGSGALIATNDDWQTTILGGIITSNQVSDIQNSGHAPTAASESAIIATLPPGNYTAIVSGVNNTTGVALVEVYDLH